MLSRLRIGSRMMLIVAVAMLSTIAVAAVSLVNLHQHLIQERRDKVRSLVEAALNVVTQIHQRVERGELTREDGQQRALDAVGAMRFGSGDYIWINDMNGVLLAHNNQSLIGRNLYDSQDATGLYYMREMLTAARAGGGFVSYHWNRSAEAPSAAKLSHVAPFAPWGWVIGTGIYIDDLDADLQEAIISNGGVATFLLAVVGGIAYWVGRGIVGPLTSITGAMARLASGDKTIEVTNAANRDEIGDLARALVTFKTNAIEMDRLRAEQNELTRRHEAERLANMADLADRLETSISEVVQAVSTAAGQMHRSAAAMVDTAETTGRQAGVVAAGSEEASANVQTVAAATEELSCSIGEIARQVDQASAVAREASAEAERTRATVGGLALAAQKIGEVVGLISRIAEQTNLLALNATIEAARAGEAGRGFAVVASEVKALAGQTAQATDEIASQIGGIQSETARAVQAIEAIGGIINQINQTSQSIASAVEQQGAATQEITRNVEQAAQGTLRVSGSISGVRDGAVETGRAAGEVLTASSDLTAQADRLRHDVQSFVGRIRAGG